MEPITLREFLENVKNSLETFFPLQYWVTAEIADLRINPNSKHCYITLVEKNENNVTAKTGAVIWKGKFNYIEKNFRKATGQQLKDGLKVLLLVEVLFHEIYGFKLNINDIDPSYTIGELALHRKKIIARLEKEGLLNRNKTVPFPLVPQKIAIISSSSAAGYEDFVNTLDSNTYGYKFKVTLFPAFMQGQQTEKSIIDALQSCLGKKEKHDIILIIRGGGDQIDLHSFDNYNIGKAIAFSPLPVITGIGHKRDETVVDIVAHTKLISPTAAAEFIIARTKEFEDKLDRISQRLVTRTNSMLFQKVSTLETAEKHLNIFINYFFEKQRRRFENTGSDFKTGVSKRIAASEFVLKQVPANLSRAVRLYIKSCINNLQRENDRLELLHPAKVLKRGYTLTMRNGKLIKNILELKNGDRIETKFHKGTLGSIVNEINKNKGI
jgi:exodeoxyribonuclease VII large subunit